MSWKATRRNEEQEAKERILRLYFMNARAKPMKLVFEREKGIET